METLRAYLSSLSPSEKLGFARRCGTTLGYLRKAISVDCKKLGGHLVVAIERESAGAVRCEDLRPDVDWAFVRNSNARKSRKRTPSVDSSPAGAAA